MSDPPRGGLGDSHSVLLRNTTTTLSLTALKKINPWFFNVTTQMARAVAEAMWTFVVDLILMRLVLLSLQVGAEVMWERGRVPVLG